MGKKRGIMGVGMVLGSLASLMVLCPHTSNVYADTSSAVRISGTSSISVALAATMDAELLPTTNGTLGWQVVDFVVNTKNTTGFRVMLQGENSALRNNHHEETIASITTSTKLANLPTNTWGVYFGATVPNNNSNFVPISTNPTEVAHNELANASGTYKLAIGVKADTSLPAGIYSNNLVVSVVAGAPEVTSLADATYMQDVTPEICANTEVWESENDSVYLLDKRDGKSYKVARLKDGNCWMQENLALALSTSNVLTPSDTDILQNWTPTANVTPSTTGSTGYATGVALAGTQGTATTNGAEYAGSICPKGWKLPLGGTANQNVSGSYYNLVVNMYGVGKNARDAANAPMYLAGNHDYVTRNAYNNANAWTDRIYAGSNYASWLSQEPFTDPVTVRCIVLVSGS